MKDWPTCLWRLTQESPGIKFQSENQQVQDSGRAMLQFRSKGRKTKPSGRWSHLLKEYQPFCSMQDFS